MSRFQVARLPELRLQMETAQTLVKSHISFVVMPCETREDFEQAIRDQARRLESLATAAEDVPSVGIVKYRCWKPSGSPYSQYDIVVNGVVDTGWCDSLEEAMGQASKVPGVKQITIKLGGDLPEERY